MDPPREVRSLSEAAEAHLTLCQCGFAGPSIPGL